MPQNSCKATVLGNTSVFKGANNGHQCVRLAKLDGYCLQHHPDNIAKREAAAVAQHKANKAKVHAGCNGEIAILKECVARLTKAIRDHDETCPYECYPILEQLNERRTT